MSVVFCDLVGSTARAERLDPEDVRAELSSFHSRVREEFERRGGTVEKFIGDAVVAVFGAPAVHEDDAERAVRAAVAIRDWAVEEGRVAVRLAVNTGEALVTIDARPESGEGLVAGDVINTAARLQSAAPVNGVLVGEATRRATQPASSTVRTRRSRRRESGSRSPSGRPSRPGRCSASTSNCGHASDSWVESASSTSCWARLRAPAPNASRNS
ncbi:MAG: hypothetical protein QOH95_1889 [Gaiellaceae bacterium]|nr:hypothetical protein [Gaiellaceae bacterium]